MRNNAVIQTTDLTYHFRKRQKTLDNIDLEVEKGSIYGFLGPNGAGKTTTLRLLLGLLKKQQGSIRLFEKELEQHRMASLKRIGSLIEQPSLYGHLTATENLEIYRKIYGLPKEKILSVLQMVGLEGTAKKRAKQFSLGMKQRLAIAVALLHDPELLILDEPTNGLDPNGIMETRELIKKLNRENQVTILVSSHLLAEVERIATHVGIINKGKLLFQGSLGALQSRMSRQKFLQIRTSDNVAAAAVLAEHGAQTIQDYVMVPYRENTVTAAMNRKLVEQDIDVFLLQPQQNDLEQIFMDITSNQNE